MAQWPSPHWGTVCCLARRACNRYGNRPRTKPWHRQLRFTCQLRFMHQRQLRLRSPAPICPAPQVETPKAADAPGAFVRQVVDYASHQTPGTVIIDTRNTFLYLVLNDTQAMRYGIGVGREGFTWSGEQTVARKTEWPDWRPPAEMLVRQPYLPRFMAGGPGNPLGARAMYLGETEYRIHGTNKPDTIGKRVSSGCIRLTNEDVVDLYERVKVGAKVIVLPATAARRPSQGAPPAPLSDPRTRHRRRTGPRQLTRRCRHLDRRSPRPSNSVLRPRFCN